MISRNVFRDRALDHLVDLVREGGVEPGAQLPSQDELARTLGLSRTAVRDAFQVLREKGMAEIRPKTGAGLTQPEQWKLFDPDVVRWRSEMKPDQNFLRDLLDLRRFVEPKAARFAAKRASADELERIETALAGMGAAATTLDDSIRWDIEFHKRIVLASGNQFVVQLVPVLEEALRFTIRLSLQKTDHTFNIPLHEVLFKRIKARDSEGTERAALELIQETSRLIASAVNDKAFNDFDRHKTREE